MVSTAEGWISDFGRDLEMFRLVGKLSWEYSQEERLEPCSQKYEENLKVGRNRFETMVSLAIDKKSSVQFFRYLVYL